MKTKVLLLTCVALTSVLVLVSCGSSTTTTSTTSSGTTAPPTSTVPVTTKASIEAPQYGGSLNVVLQSTVVQFDEAFTMGTTFGAFTHNEPAIGDWAKGPAGTGEADWTYSGNDRLRLKTGAIAESWDIPEVGTIIFHVRPGVKFGLNPELEASRLVNGRELKADDFVKSLKRICTEPRAYVKNAYPKLATQTTFTALDDYTVEIKMPASETPDGMSQWFDRNHIIAPEVAEKYGNVNKWELQVGTGPFLLTDYVEGSSATFVRNSSYWMLDPVGAGKGNQLPYVDSVKLLMIIDVSTSQAALRTGKIDSLRMGTIDDARSITSNTEGLNQKRYLEHATQTIAMHLYDPALPTSDLNVRRALFMATDLESIKNNLYEGDAEIQCWPHPYLKEYASMFLPLDEAPESVQELYTYNPDKAKELLEQAGYPNGFKASIVCRNTTADVDFLSTVKDMWSKVGIDLEIQNKELGVYTSIWMALSYEDMLYGGGMGIGGYYRMIAFDTPSYWNPGQVNDPKVKEVKARVYELFNEQRIDEVDALFKDLMKYALDQAWYIPAPLPYSYVLWWPWLKNYHGELNLGWAGTGYEWCQFIWIDKTLKNEMTGR